ncbi:MAG: serine/threonine protein kinase, partial [Labilithrix sp.]|nr:serine/threonine protein kinase [Labilithrix sp.]
MAEAPVRVLERYAMYEAFASGGMAVVHYGRMRGAVGFSRPVAIKKLHPHFATDPSFVAMFLDEARLAGRVQHPNVVQTVDAVSSQGELFVILEYVHGQSLSQLLETARERGERVPPEIAAAIVFGILEGLHAAHEARDARGELLEMVHRDVSPQNVLVGSDGVARVLDFGVAKARGRAQVTRDGALKGKLAYMAPEQIAGEASPASDVFAASIVLWEALAGHRLFTADDEGGVIGKVLHAPIPAPPGPLPAELVAVVMRGLARDRSERFTTARAMASALEASIALATPIAVGGWVARLAGTVLDERAARIASIEQEPLVVEAPAPPSSARAPGAPRDPYATVPEESLAGDAPASLRPAALAPAPLAARGRGRARLLVAALVVVSGGGALYALRRHRDAGPAPAALEAPFASANTAGSPVAASAGVV